MAGQSPTFDVRQLCPLASFSSRGCIVLFAGVAVTLGGLL